MDEPLSTETSSDEEAGNDLDPSATAEVADTNRKSSASWFRFSLKTLLVLVLVCALVAGWWSDRWRLNKQLTLSNVRIKVMRDRREFERLLQGSRQLVDFDDIDTSRADIVPLEADRYANQGIVIRGQSGQFASRTFGHPAQFPPVTRPNSFAPGPKAKKPHTANNPGGNKTNVTFTVEDRPGLASGFGVTFIDADWPSEGQCSITVFGWDGRELAVGDNISGPSGGGVFVGIVAMDEQGNLIPAISKVKIVNGSGWPSNEKVEGVTLDDLLFSLPVPNDVAK